jgi:hypothetical protein
MAKRRAKKQVSSETMEPSTPSRLTVPRGFTRPESIPAAHAHHLVATTAASFGPPPFICVSTGPGGPCLRFFRDPNTGDFTVPPGGEVIDCATCRGQR